MNRWEGRLLSRFFLLMVVLGIGALAAGYFEWKRFFGELYLEEMQAIEAAVAAGVEVEYRRAGEPRSRVASRSTDWRGQIVDSGWDRERTTVPANAPLLGRVESIKLPEPSYYRTVIPSYGMTPLPTKAVRDGLLRLPGLRMFEGVCDDFGSSGAAAPKPAPAIPRDLEQTLAQLPPLPEPALTVGETEAPLPHGDALDRSAREALAAQIAERWALERPLKTYLAQASHRPGESEGQEMVVSEIVDGDGRLVRLDWESLLKHPMDAAKWQNAVLNFEPLALLNAEGAYRFRKIDDEWRRLASVDRKADPKVFDAERFVPKFLSPEALPRLNDEGERFGFGLPLPLDQENSLGKNGSNVVAIERIDDVRLRLDLAPQSVKIWNGQFERRIEMIVREDLDFAVERFDVRLDPSRDDRRDYYMVVSVARRLARAGEAIYAQETLRYHRAHSLQPNADKLPGSESSERTLTAVIEAPTISSAVFDPLTYDPAVWPEPRVLPTIRNYRTLWSLGGGLIAIGTIGPLFLRLGARRQVRKADEGDLAVLPARLPRFRFGLATLFAAALALISAAGAIKNVRDVAARDVETLRRLEGSTEIERHDPRFPWNLFSTPAFPLDAPLKRISVGMVPGQTVPPASIEDVKELVANPRLESYRNLSAPDAGLSVDLLGDAAAALSRSLPKLPEPIPPLEEALWLYKMPEGEALSEEERTALVERLTKAWRKMSADFPQRYLLVESHDHYGDAEARATLRSGERFWTMGGRSNLFISSQDDRYRYRFGPGVYGPALVERTRIAAAPVASFPEEGDESQSLTSFFAGNPDYASSTFESPFGIDQPGCAPDPPFAFPRYLYDGIENFDAVARAALDPARIVRVSRLEGGRYRIDFDATEVSLKGNTSDWSSDASSVELWQDGSWAGSPTDEVDLSVHVREFAIIVREEFDFAVERTYFEASVYRGAPDGSPRRRSLYVTNRLVRTPEGIVVPKSSRVGDDQGGNRTWWDSRFAYDFTPEIDERIFSSPSLSDPGPYPAKEERWAITWPLVTGSLSLAMFAGLSGRRIAEAMRRRRTSGR